VFELAALSREIEANFDLEPQGYGFHPAQMGLLAEKVGQGRRWEFSWPGITRGYEVVVVDEKIPENIFFPTGGRNRERAHCATVGVPREEVVSPGGFGEKRWVTRSELERLAKKGELSPRLRAYLKSPRFDKEFEPKERGFEEFLRLSKPEN
jgi:hypothetical protein